jgi:hypothetical protein
MSIVDGCRFLSYAVGSVSGMREMLANLDEAMDRCMSVPLSARTEEELVGYLDRLHAYQQRLAAPRAALVRELEVLEAPRERTVGIKNGRPGRQRGARPRTR